MLCVMICIASRGNFRANSSQGFNIETTHAGKMYAAAVVQMITDKNEKNSPQKYYPPPIPPVHIPIQDNQKKTKKIKFLSQRRFVHTISRISQPRDHSNNRNNSNWGSIKNRDTKPQQLPTRLWNHTPDRVALHNHHPTNVFPCKLDERQPLVPRTFYPPSPSVGKALHDANFFSWLDNFPLSEMTKDIEGGKRRRG